MHLHLWLRLGIVQTSFASALALHKRSYEKRGISHIFHRKNVRFCTFFRFFFNLVEKYMFHR